MGGVECDVVQHCCRLVVEIVSLNARFMRQYDVLIDYMCDRTRLSARLIACQKCANRRVGHVYHPTQCASVTRRRRLASFVCKSELILPNSCQLSSPSTFEHYTSIKYASLTKREGQGQARTRAGQIRGAAFDDLTIHLTEGIPDQTVHIVDTDTVKGIDTNVSLSTSPVALRFHRVPVLYRISVQPAHNSKTGE